MSDLQRQEQEVAINAAKQVGLLIKEAFHSLVSNSKDTIGADLVTKTDIASQQLIQDLLSIQFPSYKFIGEESGENDYQSFFTTTCWVVSLSFLFSNKEKPSLSLTVSLFSLSLLLSFCYSLSVTLFLLLTHSPLSYSLLL